MADVPAKPDQNHW